MAVSYSSSVVAQPPVLHLLSRLTWIITVKFIHMLLLVPGRPPPETLIGNMRVVCAGLAAGGRQT